jgi:hypothetical protein
VFFNGPKRRRTKSPAGTAENHREPQSCCPRICPDHKSGCPTSPNSCEGCWVPRTSCAFPYRKAHKRPCPVQLAGISGHLAFEMWVFAFARRLLPGRSTQGSVAQVARIPEYTAIPATASTPIASRASISVCSRMPPATISCRRVVSLSPLATSRGKPCIVPSRSMCV